jgi:hypothetical protein
VKGAIVTENNGVSGVEIRSEIGDQIVIANNEPGRKGPPPVRLERMIMSA